MSERWTIEAPAKVNLRLLVLAKEETGYHSLETLFCGIGLGDTLEVERIAAGVELEVEGEIETGPPEQNLVTRAAHAYYDAAGLPGGVRIRLEKRIPSAAGLGGGSSDAAATLRCLDAMHGGELGPRRLLGIGARLGSDVPFFLAPTPYALAWGRGERILALPPLPRRDVVVAHPGTAISTAKAFTTLDGLRQGVASEPEVIDLDSIRSWERVAELGRNDFEFVAFTEIAELPRAARVMVEAGASIAMLSGSGGAIFGIFDTPVAADVADLQVSAMGMRTWRTRTLERWPEPRPATGHGIDLPVTDG